MRLELNNSARSPSAAVVQFLAGAGMDDIRHAGCSGPGRRLVEGLGISPNNAMHMEPQHEIAMDARLDGHAGGPAPEQDGHDHDTGMRFGM